jgi:hypothetical protein
MDLNDFARRVRRRGLLRVLAEGATAPPRQRPATPVATPHASPPSARPPARPAREPAPPAPEPEKLENTAEIPLDEVIAGRLAACTLSCTAVVTGLGDLPAVERRGRAIEVALLRLRVRRPEGEREVCVRQHVPAEIRGLIEPGVGLMVRAHEHDVAVAVVDWEATAARIGATLTSTSALEQYDWPPRDEWPAPGEIEIFDVNGLRERLAERRGQWILGSAELVSLTPLRSRVNQRDEWRIALHMRDGRTVQIKDRPPLLALARLYAGDEARIGAQIDVLVSPEGEVAVDWEATLRQRELRARRR